MSIFTIESIITILNSEKKSSQTYDIFDKDSDCHKSPPSVQGRTNRDNLDIPKGIHHRGWMPSLRWNSAKFSSSLLIFSRPHGFME